MEREWVVEPVDHRQRRIAEAIHGVQMKAYAAEAQLLGVQHFAPLQRTVADILASSEQFTIARLGERVIGSISVCPDGDGHDVLITSLVVEPAHWRDGVASELLRCVVQGHGASPLTVCTGANNEPALALYAQFGFKEHRRWMADGEPLELVKLRRPPAARHAR